MMHVIAILIIVSFFGCNADNFDSVIRGNDQFTANTYKELIKIPENTNFIVSGLSAEIILSLVANGARGETQTQLLDGLRLPRDIEDINKVYTEITSRLNVDTKEFKLLSANKVYLAKNFAIKKSFNDIAVRDYASEVQNLDFAESEEAANEINGWVEQKTNNKIKNLVDPKDLNAFVRLVLVNALYFSGQWKNTFKKENTADRIFYSSPTESKKIPTMQTLLGAKYYYNDILGAKFLELDFKRSNASMTFVLPDKINGLEAVEHKLEEYLAPQPMEYVDVLISLPKFKIETEVKFVPILQSFGIKKIFDGEADLTGISKEKLIVSKVLQKAFIDVNENGVEAAAATVGAYWSRPMVPPPSYEFNADHPFIFIIKENNGLILFAGRFTGKLVRLARKDSIIFSGLSAEVILSLLANGARGETKKQLLKGLSLPNKIKYINKAFTKITSDIHVLNEDAYDLTLANKIYVAPKFPIKKEFNDIAVNYYGAEVENLDFSNKAEAANVMNSWVEEKTNNRINNLINPLNLDSSTALVLINALHFSGQWQNPFPVYNTADKTFYYSLDKSKKIPTMYTESFANYAYNKQLNAKFLELEFKDSNISMTFVLPDQIDGLKAVERNLKLYLAPQNMETVKVAITLPKFQIETEINFKPILQSLGVRQLFKTGDELSNIADGPLKVDFVLQKAFIDVNENGVEAAGATAVAVQMLSLYPPATEYYFNADHPFIFIIKENNGLILFAGRFNQ
ncbi:antitrypsin-like [Diabrotica virgifera virgifera]|uniref:Serpin domain-containing protein n=1 Tax=Diabrotica virgifera virgifera TaxID=50390 RepID=A0ABM5JSI1_DIAVI|nr:antitrypsin-like [Diabrotica virgifera virgifera]